MKFGIVVDGEAELRTLRMLVSKWEKAPEIEVLMAHTDPQGEPEKQLIQICKVIRQLSRSGCSNFVVLFDLESTKWCPGSKADVLERGLAKAHQCKSKDGIYRVCYKVTTYENWLIADVEGAETLKWLSFSARQKKAVCANADNVPDASGVLDSCSTPGHKYSADKPGNAAQIIERIDYQRVAQRSKSFRRFLRLIGHGD